MAYAFGIFKYKWDFDNYIIGREGRDIFAPHLSVFSLVACNNVIKQFTLFTSK
jgi:hypothetical protein